MTQYGMVIDTKACIGCNTCAVKCKQANNVPNGILWNRILTNGGEGVDCAEGEYPNCSISHRPLACQHCADPACVRACPVAATYKDSETGIVRQDTSRCIGCRICMAACPYTGVRSFNWEEPQHYYGLTLGEADADEHVMHTVEKCVLCHNRVERGLEPACIEVCPGRARFFGDLDDPSSEVSKLVATRKWEQLLPDAGTHPSVYYLV